MLGAARSFESTTIQTMPPSIVPPAVLPQAIAGLSSAYQAATIAGPALGGVLLIGGISFVYATCALLFFVSSTFGLLHQDAPRETGARTVDAQDRVCRHRLRPQESDGAWAMSLDMFAVIFAGATALLPIFARDIFAVGSWGLGLMRAAPAVGAVLVVHHSAPLAADRRNRRPRHVWRRRTFGFATIVFGLSNSFVFSMFTLTVIGASDMLSVVIRQPLIQLETPDAMRGRVSAVNSLFIGTSNQIGEFRAGVTAGWFGTVPSVLIGGIGTLLMVLVWIKAFPALYRIDTFEQALQAIAKLFRRLCRR